METICEVLDKKIPLKSGRSYKELITFVEDRPGHDFRYAIDSSKIKRELHWAPKEKFKTGIEKTISWYLDNRRWWEAIQQKTYKQERLGTEK